jgi:hypothetical protein
MAIPDFASTGLSSSPLVDSWQQAELYIEPEQTDMDGGNIRVRSRPGRDRQRISFDILYSKADYATFKTFVKTTLNKGTSRFTMSVWMGDGMESHTVQFASQPKPTTVEPKMKVSFDLWVF